MGIVLKNGKKRVTAKATEIKKPDFNSIKEGFKILSKAEVEADRSKAYSYLL